MTPTEVLKHEHQVILLVLAAAEREAGKIARSGRVDAARVEKLLDFFGNFADRCHHAKEEDLLFVKMQERGMPREQGPIAVMLADHDKGRGYLAAVREALPAAVRDDSAAASAIAENLSAYVGMLRAHISKEDNILYPMADDLFSDQDQADLTAAFDKVEAEEMGEGVHEKYHQLAHELAEN